MKKFALITGASGGIGRSIAKKLAEEGYSLYLHYFQNKEGMRELMRELSRYDGEFIPIQADLTSAEGYKKVVANVYSIDAIVHNCGTAHYGLLIDLEQETAEKLMRIHVISPMLITKELLPKMIAQNRGNIVVISSIWGLTGAACEVAYSAAKGAQISFVKALSKEVALNGIGVNAVAPGAIKTAMMEEFSEQELTAISENIPMSKLGTADNVADAVSFLLSEKSSYITGQILSVNGGWYT